MSADDAPPAFEDTISVEQPAGYDQSPTAVWYGGATSPGGVVAYLALRRIANLTGGRNMPGRQYLANDMGISVRAVDSRLDDLVEAGWLLITPRVRPDGRGQTSNHYQLLWNPIDSADDPRLVEHRRRVAEFEAWINARQAGNGRTGVRGVRAADWNPDVARRRQEAAELMRARRAERTGGAQKTARGGGVENCAPRGVENDAPGGSKTTPLESQSSTHQTQELFRPTPAASDGVSEPTQDAGQTKPEVPRPDVDGLCDLLADLVEANGSKRPKVSKTWRAECRRMLDIDQREPDKAAALIRWCQAHPFWRANILSMPTFREKYDQLRLRAIHEWEERQARSAAAGGGIAARNSTDWAGRTGIGMPGEEETPR